MYYYYYYIIYFPGTHPTQTATVLIYIYLRDFRSENGMSSTETSPSRASLAAESAAEFPLMPTWPGTQMIFLERLADRLRCTHAETVAIVKPWEDTGSNKGPGCIFSEKPADWTNAFKLKISSLAEVSSVSSQEWVQGSWQNQRRGCCVSQE